MTTYKQKFNKKFKQDKDESNSKTKMTRLTGIPTKVLDDVVKRGEGAFKTNPQSVRPQIKSATAWGYSRLYAFIMKAYKAKEDGNDKINQDKDLYMKIKNKLK